MYRKPLTKPTEIQWEILHLIEQAGPFTIQQIKEETGYLVKEITPVLHRLQEAFLIYEDQYDGEWDRGWYIFTEMFPDCDLERYSRKDALKVVLRRFAGGGSKKKRDSCGSAGCKFRTRTGEVYGERDIVERQLMPCRWHCNGRELSPAIWISTR